MPALGGCCDKLTGGDESGGLGKPGLPTANKRTFSSSGLHRRAIATLLSVDPSDSGGREHCGGCK